MAGGRGGSIVKEGDVLVKKRVRGDRMEGRYGGRHRRRRSRKRRRVKG